MSGSLLACRQHGLEHELLSTAELSSRYPALRAARGHGRRAAARRRLPLGRALRASPWGRGPRRGRRAATRRARPRLGRPTGRRRLRPDGSRHLRGGPARPLPGRVGRRPDAASGRGASRLRRARSWRGSRRIASSTFDPQSFPVFVIESDGRDHYGFPEVGRPGFKVGRMNHPGGVVDPDAFERAVTSGELEVLREFVGGVVPGRRRRGARRGRLHVHEHPRPPFPDRPPPRRAGRRDRLGVLGSRLQVRPRRRRDPRRSRHRRVDEARDRVPEARPLPHAPLTG